MAKISAVQDYNGQRTLTQAEALQEPAFWIVSDKKDFEAIWEGVGAAALLTTDTDGTSIENWTEKRMGIGDWSDLQNIRRSPSELTVYISLHPWHTSASSVSNLIAALEKKFRSIGCKVHVLPVGEGETIAQHMKHHTLASDLAAALIEKKSNTDSSADDIKSRRAENSDVIYNLGIEDFDLHRSTLNVPFLTLKDGPAVAWTFDSGTDNSLDDYLRVRTLPILGVASDRDVSNAMKSLKAHCKQIDGQEKTLSLRSAKSALNAFWIDLGRQDGQCVSITPEGWSLADRPSEGIYFQRTELIHQLPIPAEVEDADAYQVLSTLLRPYVSVSDEDWPLVVGWMICHLLDGKMPPFLIMIAEAVAGKSTSTMAVRFAVEGHLKKGASLTDKESDLQAAMAASRVTVLNNVSQISKKQSDFFCDVFDGTEVKKKKLYTDSGTVTLEIDPSVIINGITTGILRGDFKSRSAMVKLRPMPGKMIDPEEIERRLKESHPQILGALLSLTAQILALGKVDFPDRLRTRAVAYCEILAALGQIMGTGLDALIRYSESISDMSQDCVDDLLFQVIHDRVVNPLNYNYDEGAWVLEMHNKEIRELFNNVKTEQFIQRGGLLMDRSKGMFETSQSLSSQLTRLSTDWKHVGVTHYETGRRRPASGQDKQTFYRFSFKSDGDDTPWSTAPMVPGALHESEMPMSN